MLHSFFLNFLHVFEGRYLGSKVPNIAVLGLIVKLMAHVSVGNFGRLDEVWAHNLVVKIKKGVLVDSGKFLNCDKDGQLGQQELYKHQRNLFHTWIPGSSILQLYIYFL